MQHVQINCSHFYLCYQKDSDALWLLYVLAFTSYQFQSIFSFQGKPLSFSFVSGLTGNGKVTEMAARWLNY